MEKEHDLGGQARGLESATQFQDRCLEHVGFQYLHDGVFCLSFFSICQWAFVVETASAAPERFQAPLGYRSLVREPVPDLCHSVL